MTQNQQCYQYDRFIRYKLMSSESWNDENNILKIDIWRYIAKTILYLYIFKNTYGYHKTAANEILSFVGFESSRDFDNCVRLIFEKLLNILWELN